MDYRDMNEYINTHPLDDTYSRIILHIFQNNTKPITSITELANDCYVSPSTITRFARKFSCSSFDELKKKCNEEIKIPASFVFRLTKEDTKNLRKDSKKFLNTYGNLIINSINDTMDTIDVHEIDQLLHNIHNHERVFLFGYNSTINSLKCMQAAFQKAHKFLFMSYDNDLQLELANQLKKDDLCIIVTSFGTFFTKSPVLADRLINTSAKTILITQNTSNLHSISLDNVITIAKNPDARAGSYNMDFFLDYLARRYYFLFCDD